MNSAKMVLVLFAAGLGFGYSVERVSQDAPLVSFAQQRDPAWLRELDPDYQDLVNTMKRKGFTIEENAPVCRRLDVVGFYTWGQQRVEICTDRITKLNSESSGYRRLLQQTIAHEATHVAQSCRQRSSGNTTLGLAASRLYGLPQSARSDIQKTLASHRTNHPRSVQWRIEAEAMAMEDRPEQVIAALQTFCQ